MSASPAMVELLQGKLGVFVELGTFRLDHESLRTYARNCGDEEEARGPCDVAPLPFSLTLLSFRRRGVADIRIAPGAFAVHGGHDIDQTAALRAGSRYSARSAISEIFQKSGRSGPLTVVRRETAIDDYASGANAVLLREQQVVRWTAPPPSGAPKPGRGAASPTPYLATPALRRDVGDDLGRELRIAPPRQAIVRWAGHLREREELFTNLAAARDLGFADLVVPGPMLSAFAAQMLRRTLPDWHITRLSMTFRQSVVASEALVISAVVTESDASGCLTCDIVIESSSEVCAIGSATLFETE